MRFSVVIPTYQRREIVERTVLSLERQTHRDFEIVVVVDGCTDGTAASLRALRISPPLRTLEQSNQGGAAARNAGAAVATGELLLFLDDDMEADPALLAEHDRSHRGGADVVLGDLPLHPSSPQTPLARGVGRWAEERRQRLSAVAEVGLDDILTGQISISRQAFERVGRFDASFTREGLFGGEDIDFGCRVLQAGLRVAFNADAISYQYFDVDPAAYLLRWREAGRAAQELIVKHPERAAELGRRLRFRSRSRRLLVGGLARAPASVTRPLRALAAALVRRGRHDTRTLRPFFLLRDAEYHRGARRARRADSRPRSVVLAYHAIADLRGDPILNEYGVAPDRLAEQLDSLVRHGWVFIDLQTLLAALDGGPPPPSRAILVTFDDAYADLLTDACPLLRTRGIPAVAFPVSRHIGATNEWDRPLGASALALLDADGLRTIAVSGIEIGSHGATHRPLPGLSPGELATELEGSAVQLKALGLPRPRVFSYPHGEWDSACVAAARDAEYAAAFTVSAGVVRRDAQRYALPRIEVLARDTPRTLRLKLATAGWSDRWRLLLLRLLRATA